MKFPKSLLRITGLLAAILLLLAGSAATYVYFKVKPSRLQVLMWSRMAMAMYDRKYHTAVSPAEAVEDTRSFFSYLERIHPEPAGNIGPAAYAALKESTLGEAGLLPVKDGKVQVRDLAYLLYKAAAAMKDGHTRLEWTYSPVNDGKKLFPPVSLGCVNGEFIVQSPGDSQGRRLVAVDSVPVREFLKPILERQSAETANFACLRFTSNEVFWWDFSGLLAGRERLTLTTEGPDGKKAEIQSPPLSLAEFPGKIPTGRSAAAPLTIYPADKTAWFNYPSFQYSDSEKARISAVFTAIREAGIRELVIDISRNGGGDTRIGDFILTHLTDKPFRTFSRTRWKISGEALNQSRWLGIDKSEFKSRIGEVVESEDTEESHPRPPGFFDGKVYLLVSGTTFSSASKFAAIFRDYGIGKIIGWETGGVPACYGEAILLTLPHSRIPFTVSNKQFFGPRPRPGDNTRGVMPDIPLTAALLKEHRGDARRAVLRGILKKRAMDFYHVK